MSDPGPETDASPPPGDEALQGPLDRPIAGRAQLAGVTWRSVLIATVLAPLNCYWVVMMGEVRYSGHPTTVSLFFNVIFSILVIRLLNELLRWRLPALALSQGEQLVIYTMLSIASALAGHDGIQMLAPIVAAPHWYATPENKWEQLIWPQIPRHWVVTDQESLEALFEGGTTPYTVAHLAPWIVPVLTWTVYMVVLLWVMLCINVLIRRQWTEHEKLSYPLIAVPVQITDPRGSLFRSRLLWVGFAVAAGIDILNGLQVQYPAVPHIQVRIFNIAPYVKNKPWSAIGWTPISFYPFAIGLGYLLPLDQLFSCWFFFFYWKAMRIGSSILGYEPQWWTASAPPYLNEQAFGGYVGLFVFSLWAMRRYLKDVWHRAVGGEGRAAGAEALPIPTAFWGMVLGFGVLVGFSVHAGASLWVAVTYPAMFLLLSVVVTRIRAELGHPVHDLHFAGPELVLTQIAGTQNIGKRDLTILSVYFWQNRAYRNHPMPHQLEGFKMAEETGFDKRAFAIAMVWASIIGAVGSFWGWLEPAFRMGVGAKWTGAARHFGMQPYQRLQGWLLNPQGPAWGAIVGMVVGFLCVMGLTAARSRFTGWPFHPIGFAVSGGWSMNCLWLPLLIAWFIKAIILRYGHAKWYRAGMPFFIGLVLGEFTAGSVWTIVGIAMGIPTYGFWV
jgi:hypothetical protein